MPAVVIGYGNTLRGDDGAGPEVVEAVAALELTGVQALAVPQLTPELAAVLAEAHLAVFVDACNMPESRSVQVLPLRAAPRPESLGHTSDPGALLALTEAVFGACPPAWVVRVPAVSFQLGIGLSPTTYRGCSAALQAIVRLIAAADSGNGKAGDQSTTALLHSEECHDE
jgi:hydrogenase maturation protease